MNNILSLQALPVSGLVLGEQCSNASLICSIENSTASLTGCGGGQQTQFI